LKNGDMQSIVEVPAISGNSIRHLWRESLVDVTLHTLGLKRKDLDRNTLETLVSGGGMEARDAIKNIDEEEKQEKAKTRKKAIQPLVPLLVRNREILMSAMSILSLFVVRDVNRMLPMIIKLK